MRSWGVHVSIIEPGNFIAGTSIFTEASIREMAAKMWDSMDPEVKADYGRERFEARVKLMKSYATSGVFLWF
ncbi:D-beta-hydroxybutyrate dehydrogenase, mitochondrial [Portunus trituberculatus]|uniref:D-beta-hydroxybutyrate dehydrogenase, mitochondrial n=1 Tax=Portunus trituberculatus TaxID=210409 RepID=A0A5B7J664_PORTR|nr:D-beta-hydroxybutyrate dehydrogenase, mitochondrial [Portunus trituberculatus]